MAQTFSYVTDWRIRWRYRGLVHWGRSDTIWRKWLSHCQVFWVAKDVDERISSLLNKLAQCCLICCPHIAERAVKANRRVENQRLLVVLNGTGTAT